VVTESVLLEYRSGGRYGRGRIPRIGGGFSVGIKQYKSPGKFSGGTIFAVGVTVEKAAYVDLEKEAANALARD
jgi:hypothetical protein